MAGLCEKKKKLRPCLGGGEGAKMLFSGEGGGEGK